MIYGIYLKSKPKNRWHLVSIARSAEAATLELESALKQAKAEGLEEAKVANQIFDSAFWIPQYLTEIKEQEPLYN